MTLLAILAGHGIAMPLSPGFPAHELQYIMDQSQASLFLTSQKLLEKAHEVVKEGLQSKPTLHTVEKLERSGAVVREGEVQLDDVGSDGDAGGMMLYTSGTTSRPVRLAQTRAEGVTPPRSCADLSRRKACSSLLPPFPLKRSLSSPPGSTHRKIGSSTCCRCTTFTAP